MYSCLGLRFGKRAGNLPYILAFIVCWGVPGVTGCACVAKTAGDVLSVLSDAPP